MISKYKHPVIKPISDPSRQPKVVVPPTQGQGNKKPPCRFCNETRRIVKKVAASFFRGS